MKNINQVIISYGMHEDKKTVSDPFVEHLRSVLHELKIKEVN